MSDNVENSESEPGRFDATDGGEAVCWLEYVCSDCGALTEKNATSCWRCASPIGA